MGAAGDLWDEVVGQEQAVAQLRASVRRPVHAYLFVGPEGSGKRAAARAFVADLLVAASDRPDDPDLAERTRRLVAREEHPCLIVVERRGASITVDQADDVVRRASLSPSEGELQVFLLTEFHLVGAVAPKLLKSIEEPHHRTVFVVLAEEVTPDLVTIASRCVTVEFRPIPHPVLEERLVADGVDPEVARVAAASAGGSLHRARLLAGDPQVLSRRDAWYRAVDRLDGTGAAAAVVVEELLAGVDEVLAPLVERQQGEVAALEELEEQLGVRRAGDRKLLEARHQREQRRVRTDELRAGLATLLERYRDGVVGGDTPAVAAERYAEAAGLVQELCDALVFNPRERLQLLDLFRRLPPVASPG